MSETRLTLLITIAATLLSGAFSAFTLEPIGEVIETLDLGDLPGLLVPFALSAGLAFGLCGGAVALWRMRVRPLAGAAFLVMSMLGIAAAVYVAALSYNNAEASFLWPYAAGSPVGALILAVPFAFFGPFAQPWGTIGLATALPTLWAMGVGFTFSGDAALEVPGLATLYVGWQLIFLSVFALSRRV
ncbi:hypothetical protein [Gymnodinialimonas sp.]